MTKRLSRRHKDDLDFLVSRIVAAFLSEDLDRMADTGEKYLDRVYGLAGHRKQLELRRKSSQGKSRRPYREKGEEVA